MPKKVVWLETGDYTVSLEPDDPVTVCTLYWSKGCSTKLESFGISRRKHGDAYNLELGCRLALVSALRSYELYQDYPLDKEDKAAIWAAYLKKFPVSERKEPEKIKWFKVGWATPSMAWISTGEWLRCEE